MIMIMIKSTLILAENWRYFSAIPFAICILLSKLYFNVRLFTSIWRIALINILNQTHLLCNISLTQNCILCAFKINLISNNRCIKNEEKCLDPEITPNISELNHMSWIEYSTSEIQNRDWNAKNLLRKKSVFFFLFSFNLLIFFS